MVTSMVEFGVAILVLLSAGIFLEHAIDAYHAQQKAEARHDR